jgi:hypothetical protein
LAPTCPDTSAELPVDADDAFPELLRATGVGGDVSSLAQDDFADVGLVEIEADHNHSGW